MAAAFTLTLFGRQSYGRLVGPPNVIVPLLGGAGGFLVRRAGLIDKLQHYKLGGILYAVGADSVACQTLAFGRFGPLRGEDGLGARPASLAVNEGAHR